jgi:hypothetical protein
MSGYGAISEAPDVWFSWLKAGGLDVDSARKGGSDEGGACPSIAPSEKPL